jgi:hypothetical protein
MRPSRYSIEMAMVMSRSTQRDRTSLRVCHASASLLHLYLTAHLGEIHREQLSIEHSLSNLDSAVGRLDNLFMSLYVIVAALIIMVTLVGTFFCVVLSWAKVLYLGNPTCFVNHRDWHFGPWYVISSLHTVSYCIFFWLFLDTSPNKTQLAHWFTTFSPLSYFFLCGILSTSRLAIR